MRQPNFSKAANNLLPVIVQDSETRVILMLGYMNEEAYKLTSETQKVTFFSRSKNRLWVKGETSENYLLVNNILIDCDDDTILILAKPMGPTCHTGSDTCFNEKNETNSFLYKLQGIIEARKLNPSDTSYTSELIKKGINKIAQKVGEEAVELVIESKDNNEKLFLNEAADLTYHYLVLLSAKGYSLQDVENVLKERHK
jgi:phosphoribosyl-ATP pyrophosphohydrolase/phosphoribosyl-AMP cyclohydrolase